MILDSLENRARYYALNPRLEKAFDYLLSTDLGALPAGRHAIDGDDVFINVMDVDLKRPADAKLEIHDRYLDIQVLVRGEREAFGWSQRDRVTRPLGAFDVQKDIRFYDDVPQTYYEVTSGQFTLLFPEDAHAPMVGEGDDPQGDRQGARLRFPGPFGSGRFPVLWPAGICGTGAAK